MTKLDQFMSDRSTTKKGEEIKLAKLLGGLSILALMANPALAEDKIKIGFITKFPVPFFATMEDAGVS
jgi:hypothetical protein